MLLGRRAMVLLVLIGPMLIAIVLICAAGLADGSAALAEGAAMDGVAETKADIWAREQMIYAGRSRGDLGPYVANTAANYMSWPPTSAKPVVTGTLRRQSTASPAQSREVLTMELVDFTLQGDTAIIYYRTHRTVRPDGTPADEYFDVTHTWVRQDGGWKVLGGMARLEPAQP